jgi:hypothetical protein
MPSPNTNTSNSTQNQLDATAQGIVEMAATSKATPHAVFAGNIMYINPDIKKPNEEYVLVMARLKDGAVIQEIPVALYPPKGTCEAAKADVGDLIAFPATNLVEGKLMVQVGNKDVPVCHARGFDRAPEITVLSKGRARAVIQVVEPASEGLQEAMANVASKLLSFLGVKKA